MNEDAVGPCATHGAPMTDPADTGDPRQPLEPLPQLQPVASDDPSLPGLRRAAARQGRPAKLLAAAMVALGVGFLALMTFFLPTVIAQALGRNDQVTAVVDDIGLSAHQPRKQRSGPAWTVQVHWNESGTVRRGSGEARGKTQPYQIGDVAEISVRSDSDEVSFRTDTDARVLLILLLSIPALCVGAGYYYWRSGRKWTRVAGTVTSVKPARGVVLGDLRPHRGRSSPVDLFERGYLVDIGWSEPDDATGPILLVSGMRDLPEDGQELDVWPTGTDRSPPYAIRRVDSSRWLLGSSP